jgi:hypothetical protein
MANDVVLRCADAQVRARVPAAGLNLQRLINLDSVFGVSNAEGAVREYLRRTAAVRDAVILDGQAVLHPHAPLTVDQLIPSTRVTVEARGLVALMELHSVQVSCDQQGASVAVGLESVDDDLPELMTLDTQAAAT